MTKKKSFFRQGRILVFLITFVCVFALVGTGADMSKKVVKSDERVIELANSPVRILLKGNQTYRISLDGKSFSRELPQRHEIRLRHQVFDPLVNPPQLPEFTKAQAPGGINLYIVQCVTQAIPAFQEEITAAGGEICGTLPYHSLIVAMSGETGRKVQAMPFVRWVGYYHPSFKLEQGLDDVSRIADATKTHYSLWLAKKNKKNEVANFITGIGGEVVLKGKSRRMEAKLNSNQLQRTAGNPWVLAIDLWTPKEEDMNNARDIGGADYIETVQGYTGQGVRAEVCDGGLRTTHVDFQANPPLINAGNSSSTSHGTPVFGIVFGDGTGDSNARGMIPDAEQPIFSCYNCFTDRYAHTQSVIALEGVFQTNSWGNTRTFYYTTISAEMDEIIFDLDILICQSQSNAGNQDSRPQAWAKNILSVGGVRHYDTLSRSDDCWCTGASIGPADDGRIKPDIWHFYDYTRAPYYTSDTSYTNFGGTSGATPITAGHMGLIFQMWADGVFAGGPGQARDVFDYRPHHTTAKALLIHSAYQYPFTGTSHDYTRMHQGWGMADVGNLYDMAQAHNWNFPVLIDESAVIAPLETHTYTVNVTGSDPLKATMVYADPPGVPGTTPHRINDLSLKVTAPNGTTVYWGNNGLDIGVWSTSGGSSNTIDTVENVFIQNPTSGTWTIQVLGDEIVEDGHVETGAIDADYALIVSGGTGGPVNQPPVADFTYTTNYLTVTFTDQSDDPDGTVVAWDWDFGDGNGSTQQNPVHTYATAGTYPVTLTVTDNGGATDPVTKNVTVTSAPQPPVADFTASSTTIEEGQSVNFTDTSINNPTSWSWTFEGGTPATSTAQNPTVTYNTAGTYDVSLTATNSLGSDTETKIDYITVTEPVFTVGNTTVFGSTSVSTYRRAMPFPMPEDGTISSVTMYHEAGSGSMILGVYDGEGTPQNRLGFTPTTTLNSSAGWQTINLTSPAFVAGSTTVWLAWVYENNPGIAYQTGSPGRFQSTEQWAGGMPDPFGGGSQADFLYSIYATYTPGGGPTQYTLTTNTVGNGSITLDPPGGTYNEGTVVTLTAVPDAGWQFDGWSGDLSGTQNPTTITMNSDKNVTATFSQIPVPQYTLTVNTVGQGSVTLNPPGGVYDEGTVVTLTATPDAGWQFDNWSGDLSGTQNPTTITMNSDKTVTANFSEVGTTGTVGNTTVFGSTSVSINRRAMPFTMPENGYINSVTMYHVGGSGGLILGVYDGEGTPQNRLGVTPTTTINTSAGWQTINLTGSAYVAGGSTVWLAWVYESNPGIAYQTGSPGRFQSGDTWSGGMPDPFGSGTQASYLYSIYATYTPAGGPTYGNVGNTTIFGSISTTPNRRAMPFTMPEDGTIESVSMYHEGGSGGLILAVYDGASLPQNRLGVTPTTTINSSAGWQTINLTNPVFVQGGTSIWLAWVYESIPGVRYEIGSPGRAQSGDLWAGGMPDPFGTSTQSDYIYTIYATYSK
ncbi:MAG: PKD domain-containing protein [Candidatus Aminicenantes bacterium]|nr:PKD domain-containing protein [Candidatus Aminicenantes bacterium]NIM81943.1 PKD domain-containing protein [Candidatus Aminicenantes bacterium]NIN21319.1 PKD domain-containing protein [Candidatus Aminicenantes bacterium]NIN45140.1 PKD domain-containing protein [Candidatus Aminicenantes bacterium]NIN87957.1 PKD domain-containing protein [Candidatus Aminicenantes bacterium]